jgi:protein TonB
VTNLELLDYEWMRQLITIILLLPTLTSFAQDKRSSDTTVCIFVTDPVPSYPGGIDSLRAFIKKNLKYPKGRVDYVGTVYVGFLVQEDGSTTDFKVIKGLCEVCDKNAIETLEKMPKWIPALIDEKPIRTRMIVPVKYELYTAQPRQRHISTSCN